MGSGHFFASILECACVCVWKGLLRARTPHNPIHEQPSYQTVKSNKSKACVLCLAYFAAG
jgi:hypothetical protein